MRFVLFRQGGGEAKLGVLTDEGMRDASAIVPPQHSPQATMVALIDSYEEHKNALAALDGPAVPLDQVKLLAPLPRPGKIVNCIANYWEHAQREARPLNMFLKNPDAVIGPGDTIMLPEWDEPDSFMHEAELALVFKGPAKAVERGRLALGDLRLHLPDRRDRARGRAADVAQQFSWMGKSLDTFAPIGPCIVTADEIEEPNDLWVQFWNNGELRHNYQTDDMEHRVPEIVVFITRIMTMYSGDVVACGTNHEGLGHLQDGEHVRIKIHGIGEMELDVVDPLKRSNGSAGCIWGATRRTTMRSSGIGPMSC